MGRTYIFSSKTKPFFCHLLFIVSINRTNLIIFPTKIFKNLLFSNLQIGNALVCLAVYSNQSMRTVTNIFIVNLAVADFFVILLCLPPTVVWDVTETWFLGEVLCKVVIYFQVCSLCLLAVLITSCLIMLIILFMGSVCLLNEKRKSQAAARYQLPKYTRSWKTLKKK